jgi:hypothetical protein
MSAKIRKILTIVEDTVREMDRTVDPVTRKAAAIAVIENPCAGDFVEDLESLMGIGEELGELLGSRAVDALGVSPEDIQSYGKAAIVGAAGELEHAAASAGSVSKENGCRWNPNRCPTWTQRRCLRAQPL